MSLASMAKREPESDAGKLHRSVADGDRFRSDDEDHPPDIDIMVSR